MTYPNLVGLGNTIIVSYYALVDAVILQWEVVLRLLHYQQNGRVIGGQYLLASFPQK